MVWKIRCLCRDGEHVQYNVWAFSLGDKTRGAGGNGRSGKMPLGQPPEPDDLDRVNNLWAYHYLPFSQYGTTNTGVNYFSPCTSFLVCVFVCFFLILWVISPLLWPGVYTFHYIKNIFCIFRFVVNCMSLVSWWPDPSFTMNRESRGQYTCCTLLGKNYLDWV